MTSFRYKGEDIAFS